MSDELPHRHERDPRALRALTNPLRMRLLEQLAIAGSATATELAEEIGDSPANCSWHLRQLAKYGYIEPAGGGKGRQHPWRLVRTSRSAGGSEEEGELARASDAITLALAEHEYLAYQRWQLRARSEPPEWFDAAFTTQALMFLNADELAALRDEVSEVMRRHVRMERLDPTARPPDVRMVRFFAWGVPA